MAVFIGDLERTVFRVKLAATQKGWWWISKITDAATAANQVEEAESGRAVRW